MNRHNLQLTWHAAMDKSAIGWGTDYILSKLSHKPGWLASDAKVTV